MDMGENKVKSFAAHHAQVWSGQPWYGTDCKTGMSGISPALAVHRVSGQHNIAEITHHMTQWKKFALEKIKGNAHFDIQFQGEEDWKTIDQLDEVAWNQIIDSFNEVSQSLIDQLNLKEDSLLEQIVPGRKYTYTSLLQGITEHDIYHLGQILILKKIGQHGI